MRLRATVRAAALVFALCSCVGTPQPDPSASRPASGNLRSDDATTPRPVPSPRTAEGPPEASTSGEVQLPVPAPPVDAPRASVDKIKGANAAPDARATAPPRGVADMSTSAAEAFAAWWAYEAQSVEDLQRDSIEVWSDGVSVCVQLTLHATSDAILDALEDEEGYTGTSAAAVYASALRALCPHRNSGVPSRDRIDGYLTYFDRQVAIAYDAFLEQWVFTEGSHPQIYEMGWLTKTTCAHLLDTDSATGLLEKVSGLSYWAGVTPWPRVVETATVESARSYCFGLSNRLGGAWYD